MKKNADLYIELPKTMKQRGLENFDRHFLLGNANVVKTGAFNEDTFSWKYPL